MQVEQIDREAAAHLNGYANWSVFEAAPRHGVEWMELCAHDFARHRHQARAEVVGEIVAWLREEAVIYRSAWAESVDPRASAVADHIEAKFGKTNGV